MRQTVSATVLLPAMAILLAPTEREMAEASVAIEAARETLTRLGARPILARLEAAQPVTANPALVAPATPVRAPGDALVNG